MDIKETGKDIRKGLKKVPSKQTLWMVAGATAGLLVAVMAMQAWFGDRPSVTPYVIPTVPVPVQAMPAEPATTTEGGY